MRVHDLNEGRNAVIRLSKKTVPKARFDGLDILVVREVLLAKRLAQGCWRKPYDALTGTDLARRSQPLAHVARELFQTEFSLETARTVRFSTQAR